MRALVKLAYEKLELSCTKGLIDLIKQIIISVY